MKMTRMMMTHLLPPKGIVKAEEVEVEEEAEEEEAAAGEEVLQKFIIFFKNILIIILNYYKKIIKIINIYTFNPILTYFYFDSLSFISVPSFISFII